MTKDKASMKTCHVKTSANKKQEKGILFVPVSSIDKFNNIFYKPTLH